MIARRTVIALVGATVAGLGMAVLAAPAQADTAVVVTGSLAYDSGSETWTGAIFTPDAAFGPTVTIDVSGTSGTGDFYVISSVLSRTGTACLNDGCFLESDDARTYDVDPSAANSLVTLEVQSNGKSLDNFFRVSFAVPGDDSVESGAGPAPHIQQFGVPGSGSCDEAASTDLNWSGVASGGWGESWAHWINDGEGGFVCTRTLVYNTSQAAWEVN